MVSHDRICWRQIGQARLWRLPIFVLIIVGTICLSWNLSRAQLARPILIGALTESGGPTPAIVGMRDRLVELGYKENKDFFLGVRFTNGDRTMLATGAQELIQSGATLLFTDTNATAKAAQQATTQTPIVFAGVEDPVGSGLVNSFARPGGNITGVASLDIELGPKRLQLFHAIIPTLQRVLFLYAENDIYSEQAARHYRQAAERLGIELVEKVARTEEDVKKTLGTLGQLKIDGMLTPRCCSFNIPGLILEAAKEQAIPSMHVDKVFWIEKGALAAFGTDHYNLGSRAARLVDKIIKGESPATIPVEVNSTASVEFTINLKTAKTLRLTIDPEVLYQANHLVR